MRVAGRRSPPRAPSRANARSRPNERAPQRAEASFVSRGESTVIGIQNAFTFP